MLKVIFYIVLAVPILYAVTCVVMFVVAAVMYKTGRLTKADLNRATWEWQKEKARKKAEKKAKKEAKKAARRIISISGQITIRECP
jgi:mannitol-specific phosphotransferase system IIBC component